jgi:hypothetical protein
VIVILGLVLVHPRGRVVRVRADGLAKYSRQRHAPPVGDLLQPGSLFGGQGKRQDLHRDAIFFRDMGSSLAYHDVPCRNPGTADRQTHAAAAADPGGAR